MTCSGIARIHQDFPGNLEVFVTDRYGALVAASNRTTDYYQADEVVAGGWKSVDRGHFRPTCVDENSGTFSTIIAALCTFRHEVSSVSSARLACDIGTIPGRWDSDGQDGLSFISLRGAVLTVMGGRFR
jgi:hypothetical protein